MSDIVIQVHDLWKKYRLGTLSTGTLAHDLNRWWARVRGQPDPYSKLGEGQSVEVRGQKLEGESPTPGLRPLTADLSSLADDEIWALRGVSFEVKQGEILGIIGRNGAGKSTLLKILSRTTAPTSGEIRIKGRVASLLEVGTGFHPELTGRENVFLNGAILGMTRAEIKRKFDEIVAFAEVEKFIDTPVKRYSSGMYVRLAFAVAAHLEPEILIIDEVLAVGDAQFQKKCLGKMQDVSSKEGRTVLFVSHNLAVIASLCHRSLLLQSGFNTKDGPTPEVLATYVRTSGVSPGEVRWEVSDHDANNGRLRLVAARILCDGKVTADVQIEKPIVVQYDFEVLQPRLSVCTSIHLFDKQGTWVLCGGANSRVLAPGLYQHSCVLPADFLNDGHYSLSIILLSDVTRQDVHIREAISFVVHEIQGREEYLGTVGGCIRPRLEWQERALR